MKLVKLSIFLLLSFFLVKCSSEGGNKGFPIISISPNQSIIKSKLSDIASDLSVVTLETNPDCLIGVFSALLYLDNEYIIFRSDKTILVFDGEGKFLNKINALGNGPGEYNSIVSSFVDNTNKHIYIVDYEQVLVYNYNGDFIRSYKTTFDVAGLFRNKHGKYFVPVKQVYEDSNREMLHVLDSTFGVIKSFKSRNYDIVSDVKQNLFFAGNPLTINNDVLYKEPFVDTIFKITTDSLEPYIKIELNGLGFNTKDGINTGNYQKASKSKIAPMGIDGLKNLLFFDYYYNNKRNISVFNIDLNKFVFNDINDPKLGGSSILGIKNDLLENAPNFWPKYFRDSIMVCNISPELLNKEQQDSFKVKDGDNQILFIATVKK